MQRTQDIKGDTVQETTTTFESKMCENQSDISKNIDELERNISISLENIKNNSNKQSWGRDKVKIMKDNHGESMEGNIGPTKITG